MYGSVRGVKKKGCVFTTLSAATGRTAVLINLTFTELGAFLWPDSVSMVCTVYVLLVQGVEF